MFRYKKVAMFTGTAIQDDETFKSEESLWKMVATDGNTLRKWYPYGRNVIKKDDSGVGIVYGFAWMFYGCPTHPTFTKRAGTWDSYGTFIPES